MSIEQALEVESQINENCKPIQLEYEPLPCPSCNSTNTKWNGYKELIRVGITFTCQDCRHKWRA